MSYPNHIVGRQQLAEYLECSVDGVELPPADALMGAVPMWRKKTIDNWNAGLR